MYYQNEHIMTFNKPYTPNGETIAKWNKQLC